VIKTTPLPAANHSNLQYSYLTICFHENRLYKEPVFYSTGFSLMSWLWLYKKGMSLGEPAIRSLLHYRARKGKEDPLRLHERRGEPSLPRPSGPLIWVHVASVGEALSMLTLINLILEQIPQAHILVTSITATSAQMLDTRLPKPRAFHQYAPIDHPGWVRKFLDHWKPDLALWAESEIWPNMLTMLKKRSVPAALINAHMSEKSFRNWSRAPRLAEDILSVFTVILAQSDQDAEFYRTLGGRGVVVTDNIKYSSAPLPFDPHDLDALKTALDARPAWLYASTHDAEEALACEVHAALQPRFPDLLTIIAPRHPARKEEIEAVIREHGLTFTARTGRKNLPAPADQIYLADTMGELGLLYRAVPLACVGRSFSRDGGGGHNPIEPAMLNCAVLHGPNVQNLSEIYAEMDGANAALCIKTPPDLASVIGELLASPEKLKELRESGYSFAGRKAHILSVIAQELEPLFLIAHLPILKAKI
jgi:3-deoxy-D-manno-octulosonic-acid transferase